MRTKTFQKLDLAAQRIADRLMYLHDSTGFCADAIKPYLHVKQFIMDNQSYFDNDMYGVVSMKNICKTTRQVHYVTNEVLHRLRRSKFFRRHRESTSLQMLLPL